MKQPWIRSAAFDSLWVLAPGILPVMILAVFPALFSGQQTQISPYSWIALILFVDVAHVYSTVFRTYFNPSSRRKFSMLFYAIPLAAWFAGVLLYSIGPLVFWRCLAYLAVFHFIRQQYGFVRIYSRKDDLSPLMRRLHTFAVYAFTFGPICIWHFTGPKNFNWFVEGDFIYFTWPAMAFFIKCVIGLTLVAYIASELFLAFTRNVFNLPRFLFILGTAASWYLGIVVFDGDLSFTALNVISHGIPYMALVWATGKKQDASQPGFLRHVFSSYGILLFIGVIVAFAFIEEGLWDALFWREHATFFSSFYVLDPVQSAYLAAFLVPLLSLPQVVHYVVDGFIWKMKDDKTGWSVSMK